SMPAPPLSAISRMLPGRPVGPYGSLLGSTSSTMGGPSGFRKVILYAFFGNSTSGFSIYGLVPPTSWQFPTSPRITADAAPYSRCQLICERTDGSHTSPLFELRFRGVTL